MKTAFVIQIVQLSQYGTKSTNTDLFSCWPILVFRMILCRFYIRINDKIETI